MGAAKRKKYPQCTDCGVKLPRGSMCVQCGVSRRLLDRIHNERPLVLPAAARRAEIHRARAAELNKFLERGPT